MKIEYEEIEYEEMSIEKDVKANQNLLRLDLPKVTRQRTNTEKKYRK